MDWTKHNEEAEGNTLAITKGREVSYKTALR